MLRKDCKGFELSWNVKLKQTAIKYDNFDKSGRRQQQKKRLVEGFASAGSALNKWFCWANEQDFFCKWTFSQKNLATGVAWSVGFFARAR